MPYNYCSPTPQVSKARPNDKDAMSKFTECNKIVKRLAFEKAISCDVTDKTLAELHTELEFISKRRSYILYLLQFLHLNTNTKKKQR